MQIKQEIKNRLAMLDQERRLLMEIQRLVDKGSKKSTMTPVNTTATEKTTWTMIQESLKTGPKSIYNLAGPRGTKKFRRFEVAAYKGVKSGKLVKIAPAVFALNTEK